MRLLTALTLAVALLCSPALASAADDVTVKGYFRQVGTYVQPHVRSAPDSSYNNNWSTSPNVNPYTGQQGTNQPRLYDPNPPTGYGNSNPWGGGWTQPKPKSRW